ncbi:uncharacterized protein LOC119835687 [Zerene cesonia]|uniref:uncharacterized protein LOC119835687 n=1 Tax=Zerene cesonia TaxID=33412 RepID=UPI0018E54EFE|nr:uncharacterized protein LOC119835687 [Zerene cesonia]
MFNIESYITPILLSYVDKYVRDFKPADAQVSLWAGGVTLHNLVLKADVLQKEVALPFTLVSGRIHELLIQVPWTKIMSEPIVVTINTIECILSLNPPSPEESPPPESPRTQVVEAPPGYMQALVRRIVSNISVRVHSLIVKYVHDDIVLSLNVKRLAVDSVGADWQPQFADIDQVEPVIRRLVRLDDLTLCLDKSDSDGKIRFYQEPLLYRCQLDLRVLTRLVSANTRRARSLSVQLRSSRLAWGVTSEQLVLLLRLLKERSLVDIKPPSPVPKAPSVQQAPLHSVSSNSAEPARSESWSEWAWSWLPTWMDRDGVEETPAPATPIPIAFTAYLEHVALVFKVMEIEGGRKRARGVLEVSATDAVAKSSVCSPSTLRVQVGARRLALLSHGRCVCGHVGVDALNDAPTTYLSKTGDHDEAWCWIDEDFIDQKIELGVAAEEQLGEPLPTQSGNVSDSQTEQNQDQIPTETDERDEAKDTFWTKMAPVVYVEYNHDRVPSDRLVNPYDNPPKDFEYSDWVEDSVMKIVVSPMSVRVSTGLLHRLAVIRNALNSVPLFNDEDPPTRTLTVEECEALSENLPQRRIGIEINGVTIRLMPWDHSPNEKPLDASIVLDVDVPKAMFNVAAPLYPLRVCSAACQMPEDSGPLWQGARLHVSGTITAIQATLISLADNKSRPCARADVRFVTHSLLHRNYFAEESVVFSYSVKIREASVCGSSARLQTAWYIPISLCNQKISMPLKHTTVAKDALTDEESVAIELTLEELSVRGYITRNIHTHILTLHSVRATAHHAPTDGEEAKQAWLFSGPDSPTTTPYLRSAFQWCKEPTQNALDYIGIWLEPMALCVDPLLVAWLGYRPKVKITESRSQTSSLKMTSSSQYLLKRRTTPPSSSGRGGSRSGSGAEVHVKTRSVESSSERSDKKEPKPGVPPPAADAWWSEERLLRLHARLRRVLVTCECGLLLVYVTAASASAVHCATVRDAIERHALALNRVLAVSLGRWSIHSNSSMKHLWQEIRHDGPTFLSPKNEEIDESFPWKMRIADVSCYTLEVRAGTERSGKEKAASGLRSHLKTSRVAIPRTVLELVTTTVTLSVVTKSLQIKAIPRRSESKKHADSSREDEKLKYFTGGVDFKPSSLKEFVRGPARRKKQSSPEPKEPEPAAESVESNIRAGPIVSLGVNLHADTPPVTVRLDSDQVHVVVVAIHCFTHVLKLLRRPPLAIPKQSFTSAGGSRRSLIRSVSEIDEVRSLSEETESGNPSELISIFEAHPERDPIKMKTFFWFQWVVSHASLVFTTSTAKLVFDTDDVISSVDLQEHYNQFKVKIASASVKHFDRTGSDEWTAGVLGGRVLEAREPTNAKEESHFLAVTITQALISNLPASWKEELHPKLLEQNAKEDSMWEIYATLAPLEVVLRPTVLEQIVCLFRVLVPKSYCPLKNEETRLSNWQWPFCYVTAGGLRLLLTDEIVTNEDDTIMLIIGKVTVNPHPENPICRRAVNPGTENAWTTSGIGMEGRQYEVLLKNIAIRSARFKQLVNQEAVESEILKTTGGENPALKWSQPVVSPCITPVLHSVDVSCVLAPAFFHCGALTCGPAVEVNLVSDCAIELSVDRLGVAMLILGHVAGLLRTGKKDSSAALIEDSVCPYVELIMDQMSPDISPTDSDATISEETTKSAPELSRGLMADSGIDTATSQSTYKFGRREPSAPLKKSVSIAFTDYNAKASDYLELFVTMGVIEVSLYANDTGAPELSLLRSPGTYRPPAREAADEPVIKVVIDESREAKREDAQSSATASRSLTDTIRHADLAQRKIDLANVLPLARKTEGNLPLLHVTLHQPNLYYWRRKANRNIQVSLFNMWVGLGGGLADAQWHCPLVSAARGSPDPVTDIPPALATLRLEMAPGNYSGSSSNSRGSVQLDVERPLLFEVSTDRLRRLKGIIKLVNKNLPQRKNDSQSCVPKVPVLYKLRRFMVRNSIDSITMHTNQVAVRGEWGAGGWEGASAQLAAGSKPERLCCRALLTALLATAGAPTDTRHVLLQPMMAGMRLDATWEAWRRAEGGLVAREPNIRLAIDLDRMGLDVRPEDLAAIAQLREILKELGENSEEACSEKNETFMPGPASSISGLYQAASVHQPSVISIEGRDGSDHNYYKDDLRSGAFKIISGGQLPMAYQIMLQGDSVSWRYPHPRAITRLIAFPLPGQEEEIECVLELYSPLLHRWETHTCFKLPIHEQRELKLNVRSNDAVFALMWRVRVCSHSDVNAPPFEFDMRKFMPCRDPMMYDQPPVCDYYQKSSPISGEQLSGVLRVDSYFAPRLLPRFRLALRLACFEFNVHNALPKIAREASNLEGYYVSRPLSRSHRTLSVRVTDAALHLLVACSAKIIFDAKLSSDIIDSSTGAMEQFVDEFRTQGSVEVASEPRLRLRASALRAALHLQRVRTLRALADDWATAYHRVLNRTKRATGTEHKSLKASLDGLISLWVHNNCAIALRIGQEGTDEVIPLGPGVSLAYRWRSPAAPKMLRFALAGPSTDWHWSTSIPFSEGTRRVRLEDAEGLLTDYSGGMSLYVRVAENGARRNMYLSGRLLVVNMLRLPLLYKVRSLRSSQNAWQTISSGELQPETIGWSVLCNSDSDAVLKVRFNTQEAGWSGDIPLKECRKENVPWLVKVPNTGDVPYISVWCRVVRARSDGRIVATIWPFYVLTSHLPLDTDVLISTELSQAELEDAQLPAIVQTALGRGASTHLSAPGTTSARHTLSFQYRNIDCPVTRDAVPLHYGVTDTSVFEKPTAVNNVDELLDILRQWLNRSARDAKTTWPYSVVTSHWPGTWQPALLQPRCDINVRYNPVRAGGGCSLELQLCPVVLLANASPIALTLRAYDAAPLCKLEPGVAISPPTIILKKPFFMSVEMGRETFVSGQLEVCGEEPGRYGQPAPGRVALDRPAACAIHCNHKVALLTLYYEIKEDINVLGVTSTYIIINRLQTDILVSAIAVPNEVDSHCVLQPKTYKVVHPTDEGSIHGTPLSRFWVRGRWRGGHAEELRPYLCLTLPGAAHSTTVAPIRLAASPLRRPIALKDDNGSSVPVVVCQQLHEGRWIITVAEDPCPQFLIQNRTGKPLAVAQPIQFDGSSELEPKQGRNRSQVVEECAGARWWCAVEAHAGAHYSTPAYCARYPPAEETRPTLPLLVVGVVREELDPDWSQPMAVADGEQLLQLSGGLTIKVRVRTHPHSTLIELQDIDQFDISASDIRRRLVDPFIAKESFSPYKSVQHDEASLQRITADNNLMPEDSRSRTYPEDEPLLSVASTTQSICPSKVTKAEKKEKQNMVVMTEIDALKDSSIAKLSSAVRNDINAAFDKLQSSSLTVAHDETIDMSETSIMLQGVTDTEWSDSSHMWSEIDRVRCVIDSIAISVASAAEDLPIMALYLQRAAVSLKDNVRKTKVTISVVDVQVDNAQYDTGQYDFAVVATTRAETVDGDPWPPLWNMGEEDFDMKVEDARLMVVTCNDKWTVGGNSFNELTEIEIRIGPLGLYIEDAYVSALVGLARVVPGRDRGSVDGNEGSEIALAEAALLQRPLRLRKLLIHPLDLTLTLHTAVRMYIALDQSPLRLSAFQLQDVMTSPGRLTHALTVHYLSAAILGAGWVVGGLELLGAPGALAARVGGAGGGLRGVASAAAAALLRSLSACAGSLARNLDLLAGDEQHARRAAAARRRPPPSLMAGLFAGITNFAINILGAVGGLAHHPLVGVAVGETESGTAALRRGLLGAITKPLSATADLVAYAGHGLLTQTGWDPVPQPRWVAKPEVEAQFGGWQRDCVRWAFRLSELAAFTGFSVLLADVQLHLLITHKFLVIAEPESERIIEMIDFKSCTLGPYQGQIIELHVSQRKPSRISESRVALDEDNEYQISAAAMARVARYTGAEGCGAGAGAEERVLALLPAPGRAHALHAALAAAAHHNTGEHTPLL